MSVHIVVEDFNSTSSARNFINSFIPQNYKSSIKDQRPKSSLLYSLLFRYKGICTNCSSQVMMDRDAIKLGHKIRSRDIKMTNGRIIKRASIEHIKRRIDGGSDDLSNLTLLCADCNFNQEVKTQQAIQHMYYI